MLRSTLVFTALLLVLHNSDVAAQRVVTVMDQARNRISDAAVEVWNSAQRLERFETDRNGTATFSGAVDPSALLMYVTHPNFASAYHRLNAGWPDTIRLTPRPLPTIEVLEPKRCPNREDPAARALWARVSARYKPIPEGALVGTGFFLHKTIGGREVLGRV